MSRLAVPYGYSPKQNVTLARTGAATKVLHLAAYSEDGASVEPQAVCGVQVHPVEFATGELCPKCQRAMGIGGLGDFDRDDEEASWMEAQR